jgi:hypothetical protein
LQFSLATFAIFFARRPIEVTTFFSSIAAGLQRSIDRACDKEDPHGN